MKKVRFNYVEGGSGFWLLLALLALPIVAGLGSALYMETNGHWVTGMTNQVVWGMPHVFAIFLIVAASGALNIASIGSVFGKTMYKPLAPLSGLLAIALLVGGLCVLVLDLGRPDRLISVAMVKYNFKSIFAWNIILYMGFMAIVATYLWTMMDRSMKKYSHKVGVFAFVWRLVLTTGTGSIFGFLLSRSAYSSAVMAPMFIVMSFAFGLAFFLLVLMFTYNATKRPLGDAVVMRLKNLLGVFIAGVLYFVVAFHLTNLYWAKQQGVEAFILMNGGIYTQLFWIVQIGLGSLLPLALLYGPTGKSRASIATASVLVILGGLAQVYVIVIGGQAYPIDIYPGYEVISSSFFDGQVNTYNPTLPEFLLGLSGFAITLVATAIAVKVLRFLPESLGDEAVTTEEQEEAEAAKAHA